MVRQTNVLYIAVAQLGGSWPPEIFSFLGAPTCIGALESRALGKYRGPYRQWAPIDDV